MTGIVWGYFFKAGRMKESVVQELKLKTRSIQFFSFQELPARAEGDILHETTAISLKNIMLDPEVTFGGNSARSLIFQMRKVGCILPNSLS